ncbi:peroxisomal membrane protein 2 isoform X2 [Rhinopithecus roxellana]|uniref:Peroxisomal membrane protein 2 n=1 Tax=Rhinopithecus roxellana TaxID=61622 RepID=A0A2K6NPT1_RHIRO|nr:peroxisomal membrane protein 2 isoform X2 [Rhinopithecus roxellana]
MAPAVSRLRAEAGLWALPQRALAQYLLLLRLYPVLTKAATSGVLSALGNFLAQMIEKKRKKENSGSLDVGGPLRYAVYGSGCSSPTWQLCSGMPTWPPWGSDNRWKNIRCTVDMGLGVSRAQREQNQPSQDVTASKSGDSRRPKMMDREADLSMSDSQCQTLSVRLSMSEPCV